MDIETVETATLPILYVRQTTSMEPEEIGKAMGVAFGTLGAFIGRAGVKPTGPAVAVYRNMREGGMDVDVGFPASPEDIGKAEGDVQAGEIPACKALKAVHHGPYPKLRETWGAVHAKMKEDGHPMPSFGWEVYLSDPQNTAPEDLLTEVYMPIVSTS